MQIKKADTEFVNESLLGYLLDLTIAEGRNKNIPQTLPHKTNKHKRKTETRRNRKQNIYYHALLALSFCSSNKNFFFLLLEAATLVFVVPS